MHQKKQPTIANLKLKDNLMEKNLKNKKIKYLLSVEEDTWAAFKSKCALNKIKIKDALAQMIQTFISSQS